MQVRFAAAWVNGLEREALGEKAFTALSAAVREPAVHQALDALPYQDRLSLSFTPLGQGAPEAAQPEMIRLESGGYREGEGWRHFVDLPVRRIRQNAPKAVREAATRLVQDAVTHHYNAFKNLMTALPEGFRPTLVYKPQQPAFPIELKFPFPTPVSQTGQSAG